MEHNVAISSFKLWHWPTLPTVPELNCPNESQTQVTHNPPNNTLLSFTLTKPNQAPQSGMTSSCFSS
jgi:hypothetical protein